MLTKNDKAPNFTLNGIDTNLTNTTFNLLENLSKPVVIYFYPKDDTPGCTAQACNLRDNMAELLQKATVIGISKDNLESHKKFMEKYNLNYTLLSDDNLDVFNLYYPRENLTEIKYKRNTFVVSTDGKILQAWYGVNASEDIENILATLNSL
jgi:peroxiredoxin Q/BCP